MNNKKIAVILFNLGGPDSAKAIKPFLMNFFMDSNIIKAPLPIRYLIASLIAWRRSKKEAKESYDEIGGKSPLLTNTQAQAVQLEKVLNQNENQKEYKTFVCMRYWHPMAEQVVQDVKTWEPEEIILLPLYPQFSTTTTWSSLEAWNKAVKKAEYNISTSMVCCYPNNAGFIEASVENIKVQIEKAKINNHNNFRLLLSAHGLPESIIKSGDPYQWQCEKTAKAIIEKLNIKDLDWSICYQSRVGPKKWIAPSTKNEIKRAAKDKKAIIIYPHAFTQEHVETLVELDIEYKELAEELNIQGYYRAKTVSTHLAFIDGLVKLIQNQEGSSKIHAENESCICLDKYSRCCMKSVV